MSSAFVPLLAAVVLAVSTLAPARAEVADPSSADESAAAGAPILRGIEIRSDGPVDTALVERLLGFEIGRPIPPAAGRRALRSLRHAEIATRAAIELVAAAPAPDGSPGVVARVVLRTPIRLAHVDVVGDKGLKEERLTGLLELRAGEPLVEDRIVRGVYALQDRLAEEGWLDAAVHLEVEVDEAKRAADVTYVVAAGERAKVAAVHFEGAEGIATQAELEKVLRIGPGDPYRSRMAKDDAELVQRLLVRRDYRLARVDALAVAREPGVAAVTLGYRVTPGPKFFVEIVGAERKRLEKRDLLPFLADSGFDDALVLQSVERIERDFQERGHYRVEVKREEERSDDRYQLKLTIVPGPRLSLEEVSFSGNEAFDEARLRRLMSTAPRRLLTPRSGRLVDAELAADLSNLRSFYALEGFDHARVGPARVEESDGRLAVRVPIVEGRRRTVTKLVFQGLAPLDERELRRVLPLAEGGPYHRLRVEQTEDLVRSKLGELGYMSALVDSAVAWSEDDLEASVTVSAVPGQREVVSSVVVRSYGAARPEIVERFVGIEPGDPLGHTALLDLQRRLYALGIFSRVEVKVPPTTETGESRDVVIDVEEGRSRAVSVGLGYDSESGARGLLRLSHSDLFGRLQSLTLDLLVSQREHHSRLIFRQPYLGHFLATFQGAIFNEHEERPDFTVDRRGFQVSVERPIDRFSLQLGLGYRLVELDAAENNANVPLDARDAHVASVTQGVSYDRRDDLIDPKRGWFANAQLEYAAPVASADADFLKLFGQLAWYRPFGASVLAASLRAGAIEPLADPGDTGLDPLDASVPAAERFYAGGRTSHRAYERDSLGIPGETISVDPEIDDGEPFPLGGGGLLLANVELRFPVAGPVGGTIFVDGGNVFTHYDDIDPSRLKWGAGLGVRYLSPIGPLRLEIGWKLDREPYEDPYVWFFSLGNSF